MVTRWRGFCASFLLLWLVTQAAGQCAAPKLRMFSSADIGPNLSNGQFSVGTIINVWCVPGFKTVGFTKFNCQTNGKWTPSAWPTCAILSCPKPKDTSNGYFTGTYQFNGTISYQCDQGYTLNGDIERHCLANQTWSGTTPLCQKTVCPTNWTAYSGNCYYIGDEQLAFTAARARCQKTPGADLVSILTNLESNFITSWLSQRNYTTEQRLWIGLTDMDGDKGYTWYQTGAFPDYAQWECGKPGSQKCAAVYAGSLKTGLWVDNSCSGTIGGYICKQGKIPIVPLIRGDCPSGWFALGNKCYKFEMSAPTLNWNDAAKACKSNYNATLMSASDPKQMALLLTYVNKYYPSTNKQLWMGYRQIENEHSPWTWSDFTCTQYTAWGCGEPNNAGWRGEDCMSISFGKTQRNAGRWNDDNCANRKQYVCERPYSFTAVSSAVSPICDANGLKCPSGWLQNGRSCYYIETNDRDSWPGAVNKCHMKNGAGLVSITDASEQEFITNSLLQLNVKSEINLWIGMNKDISYYSFSWPDGTVALYRNWDCDFMSSSSSWTRRCAYSFVGPRTPARRDGYWGAGYCYSYVQQDGYICEASIPFATLPRYQQGICETGWIQNARSCYYPATNSAAKMSWDNARLDCQKRGADLSVLNTKEENVFMLDYFNFNEPMFDQPIWFGLRVFNPVGTANNQTFSWVNNDTLASSTYTHWGCGEPNNYGGKEHCGVVGVGPGNEMSSFWNDDECRKKFNYMCEKPAPKVSPCKDGWWWSKATRSCYYAETNRTVNFTQAATECAAKGAMLLTVLDATEQKFLTAQLLKLQLPSSMSLWIGLNDTDSNKVFAWNDGTHPFYNNFECNQPGGGGTNGCATMYAGGSHAGQWVDFGCSLNYGYICKTVGPGLKQLHPLSQGNCSTGWYQYRDQCYYFELSQSSAFDSAQTQCKSLGTNAQLAIIPDDGVLDFFLHVMYQKYPTSVKNMYVGLKKARNFGAFEWQDGSCSSYYRWGCGEPNNHGNRENCGVFGVGANNHNSAKINDDACYKRQHFVCQSPAPGTAAVTAKPTCNVTPCPTGWSMYRGNCYYVNVGVGTYSYSDASNWCITSGGALASVTDMGVNDYLAKLLRSYRLKTGTEIWMGWRSDNSQWPDGTSTLYRNWECAWYNSAPSWFTYCGFLFAGGSTSVLGKWGATNCYSGTTRSGFICQMNKPMTTAVSTYRKYSQGVCAAGWVQFGNQCYLFKLETTDRTTHANALKNCLAQGAVLASPSERQQNDDIIRYLLSTRPTYSSPIWIGLYQKTPKDPFRWEDGSRLVYTNWNCGEPNNAGGSEDCAQISMGTGSFSSSMWNDDRCSQLYNYFCQRPTPSLHPCPPGFFRNHESCYLFNVTASVDYAVAARECAASGAKLVTIRDRVEQFFLESILANLGSRWTKSGPQRYWTGLRDTNSDNVYQWTDSSYALYMNWKCGSPGSGGSQACVTFENSLTATSGKWDDASCSMNADGYICEMYTGTSESLASTAQGNCASGWTEYGDTCYEFNLASTDKSTYAEATKLCNNQGGQLLSVHDDATHAFITQYITQKQNSFDGAVWMSLSKIQGNRYSAFHWADGSCLNYNQWGCNEPNDASSGENCALIGIGQRNPLSGSWNDDGCSKAYNYICERSVNYSANSVGGKPAKPVAGSCAYSVQCPAGWMKMGKSCFWATTNTKMSWSNAAKDCQTRGGALVSVADASQQMLLRTFMSRLNVTSAVKLWIGLNDADRSGSYIWPDGSAGFYRYWDCPSRKAGKCVFANSTTGRWGKDYCSSSANVDGYVCQWSPATPQYTPEVMEQGICQPGWYQRKHLCYKFETTSKLSFSDANNACQGVNGTLVAIDNMAVQSFVMHYFLQRNPSYGDTLWIGLHQSTRNAPWMWQDGSNTTGGFTNWGCGEPNDAGSTGEDCAKIVINQNDDNSGLWNDDRCASQSHYICQKPVPQLTPCVYGWEYNAASDSCFYIETKKNVTYSAAQAWCQAEIPGADLVSILDPQEQEFLAWQIKAYNASSGSQLWIGLTDTDGDQYYQWPDKTKTSYTNFDCGISWWRRKPCVYMQTDGFWNLDGCTTKQSGFICKASVPKKDELDTYKLRQGACNKTGYYEFQGNCWYFEDVAKSDYDIARQTCQSLGGDLASIANSMESSFVVRYRAWKYPSAPSAWIAIGYQKPANTFDQFHWSDGSCANYNSWGCNEPNNAGRGEPCAQYQFGGQTGSIGFSGAWNDAGCTSKNNYICKLPLPSSVAKVPCAAVSCKPGWVSWRGSCYLFVPDDSQSWPNAYTQCLKKNSALLSISDFTEQAWVTRQLNNLNLPAEKELWIGLNNKNNLGYDWPDGTTAFYRNWDCAAIAGYNQRCSYMLAGFRSSGAQRTGKWGADSCYSSSFSTYYNKDGYVCESSVPNANGNVPLYTQGTCDPGWAWFNGQCFYFSRDTANFTTAMANCSSLGGSLAMPSTMAKDNFVIDYMIRSWGNFTGGRFWIGLWQPTKSSPFVWVDRNVSINYTNYYCNEPNDAGAAGEDCIEYVITRSNANSGTWNDVPCSLTMNYICEKAGRVTVPPTTTPTTTPTTVPTTVPTTTPATTPRQTTQPTTKGRTTVPPPTTTSLIQESTTVAPTTPQGPTLPADPKVWSKNQTHDWLTRNGFGDIVMKLPDYTAGGILTIGLDRVALEIGNRREAEALFEKLTGLRPTTIGPTQTDGGDIGGSGSSSGGLATGAIVAIVVVVVVLVVGAGLVLLFIKNRQATPGTGVSYNKQQDNAMLVNAPGDMSATNPAFDNAEYAQAMRRDVGGIQ